MSCTRQRTHIRCVHFNCFLCKIPNISLEAYFKFNNNFLSVETPIFFPLFTLSRNFLEPSNFEIITNSNVFTCNSIVSWCKISLRSRSNCRAIPSFLLSLLLLLLQACNWLYPYYMIHSLKFNDDASTFRDCRLL